jgi:hypothetical protein
MDLADLISTLQTRKDSETETNASLDRWIRLEDRVFACFALWLNAAQLDSQPAEDVYNFELKKLATACRRARTKLCIKLNIDKNLALELLERRRSTKAKPEGDYQSLLSQKAGVEADLLLMPYEWAYRAELIVKLHPKDYVLKRR